MCGVVLCMKGVCVDGIRIMYPFFFFLQRGPGRFVVFDLYIYQSPCNLILVLEQERILYSMLDTNSNMR